jgi:RHS repeat-associated protein
MIRYVRHQQSCAEGTPEHRGRYPRLCGLLLLISPAMLAQNLMLSNQTVTSGTQAYAQSNSITAENGYTVSGSASVTFTAGSQIVLLPGFQATAGSASVTFQAQIAPSGSLSGPVATPTFNPPGGTYSFAQTVTISTSTTGATIRYTTNGTPPSETNGTVYTGPVVVATTGTLTAAAFRSGWFDSGVASASYNYGQVTPPGTGGGSGGGGNSGTPTGDSGNGLDPRRTGVRTYGSYWGAAGEQIDTTSGNLNFSLPLLKMMGRGGFGVTARLSYDSQMWRNDSAGDWLLGYDVGYGLGWRLQVGSLIPVWGTSAIDHYLFVDSTGAEYSLSVNNGGVWTSQEGVYLAYDSNANRIYQPDGSFWLMGSVSSGGEQDAGVMYPTQIEDTNGNQIIIQYATGAGSGSVNTSARISTISDARATFSSGVSYSFTYNNDTIPHLQNVYNYLGTAESYLFGYSVNSLSSPFDSSSFGTTTVLQSVSAGFAGPTAFTYSAGSAEMLSMTTALGGSLNWAYGAFTYSGGVQLREVQSRTTPSLPNSTWSFTHDGASQPQYHTTTTIADSSAGTQKVYTNGVPLSGLVVPVEYQEIDHNGTELLRKNYGWTTDMAGNAYMNSVTTSLDPNGTNIQSMNVQTLDGYGNLAVSQAFDYGNLTTAARTYYYSYLSDTNYTSNHIRNRLILASVTANGVNTPLVSIAYDGTTCGALQDQSNLPVHDSTYDANHLYRGNPTSVTRFGAATCTAYQITGVPYAAKDAAGNTMSLSTSTSTNYSLPGVLTPNGNSNLATSISYAASFAVTSVAGPNGATTNTNYDQFGRPASSTSTDGAVTSYSYTYSPNPNTQTATIGTTTTQWKKTTLDGFGRTLSVQTGHDNSTSDVAEVDTQYAACACSPLGKLWRVSLPYAPGNAPSSDPTVKVGWTTSTYDGSGRTLTVTKPDGTSVTTYSYPTSVTDPVGNNWQGNFTKTVDPAGAWKIQQTDSFGNLIRVLEPNPAGTNLAWLVTTYSYTVLNQLSQVQMTRNGVTQTRTFQYTGTDLTSSTNPESGTVTYQYDALHHVTLRTDAKSQQTQYFYDTYGRLTGNHHLPTQIPNGYGGYNLVDNSGQDVNYYYDTNTFDTSFSQNAWGRLTATTFANNNFTYMYSYNQAGRVTGQRLRSIFPPPPGGSAVNTDFDASYTWDNQGRMTSLGYPMSGNYYESQTVFNYQFDAMGRPSGMTTQGCANGGDPPGCLYTQTIATANYTTTGQLSTMTYDNLIETRTYNNLLQLQRMTVYEQPVNQMTIGNIMDMQYNYTAGANNGRISSSVDYIAGETVNYTYDLLNRLATAATTTGSWAQAYSYDGFGNLTGVNGAGVYTPDPATNRPGVPGGYDANGLPLGFGGAYNTWDMENRLVAQSALGGPTWTYDPNGKRIQKSANPASDGTPQPEIYFYSISGQKIATFDSNWDGTHLNWSPASTNVYFAGKLIRSKGVTVATDRLGSVRANVNGDRMRYLPYGQEITSTADNREKFGTYFRDGQGQDYADQRYYNQQGSFWTPDPGGLAAGDSLDPGSWNRYAYGSGDPVNRMDPRGMADCLVDGDCPALATGDSSPSQTTCSPGDTFDYYYSLADGLSGPVSLPGCTVFLAPLMAVAAPSPPSAPNISLKFIDDCVLPSGTGINPGQYTLAVEYQVLVNGTPVYGNAALDALGISVSEKVNVTSGPAITAGGTWCPVGGNCATPGSMTPNGMFWDLYGSNPKGDSTADQTYYMNGQALQVTNFSGSPTVLKNKYKKKSISVGGSSVTSGPDTRKCGTKNGDPAAR